MRSVQPVHRKVSHPPSTDPPPQWLRTGLHLLVDGGGWKRGRNEVLVELKAVHGSFLNGATDAAESMAVTSAGPGDAVVTVISKMSAFTMPNGVAHRNDRQIRCWVPDDHVPFRSLPLFRARDVMAGLIESLKAANPS